MTTHKGFMVGKWTLGYIATIVTVELIIVLIQALTGWGK